MKSKVLWLMLGIGLIGLVGFRLAQRSKARAQVAKPAETSVLLIRAAQVSRRTVPETVSLTGSIRPRNEVQVVPKVGGRLESLQVEVGDRVREGQVLAVIEHKELMWQARAAQAALKVAQANMEGARLDFERTEALFKSNAATQAQFEAAKMRLALTEAQAAQAEAGAGLAQQQVANARVSAPISGVVTKRSVNQGAQVGPQSNLFTLQDLDVLTMDTSVDAAQLARLRKGAAATVQVDLFPSESFPAQVSVISPSLDSATRRADVELSVDNSQKRLVSNLFVRAEIQVGTLENALIIPRAAVLEGAGGARVFRLNGEVVQEVRPKLGPSAGDDVVVLEGLSESDQVAITDVPNLSDGARVRLATEQRAALDSSTGRRE